MPPFSLHPFNSIQPFPSPPPLRLSSSPLLLQLMHSVPPLVAFPEYPVLPLPLSLSVRICSLGSSLLACSCVCFLLLLACSRAHMRACALHAIHPYNPCPRREWAMLRLELFLDSTVKTSLKSSSGLQHQGLGSTLRSNSPRSHPVSQFTSPLPPSASCPAISHGVFQASCSDAFPLARCILCLFSSSPHPPYPLRPRLLPLFSLLLQTHLLPPASAIVYLAFSLLLPMAWPIHTPAGMLHAVAAAWVSFNILFNFYCAATRHPGSPPPLAVSHCSGWVGESTSLGESTRVYEKGMLHGMAAA
ncbi:unnamed protein product [Closterium sp. NIES-54]